MRALGVGAPRAKDAIGPPQVFRQSITDSFIVYGKRRVGGLLVFFHPRQVGGEHYRYFVIAVAGHRCKGVVKWMLGDEEVTVDGSDWNGMVNSGKYAGACWLWFQRGLASETANATFVSECGGKWTADHKGNDVAAIYAKFAMTDKVIEAGMPNITAIVEGHDNVSDPRTGSGQYTRNASLIFYHWMKTAREEGGFGAYPDEMPSDAFQSAQANVCDEVLNGNPRYQIDAVLTTGAAPAEVRDALIVNMAGSYTYSGGKHLMRPGYWVPPSVTLSEDDLAGPIQVSPFMTSDAAANEVQGTYIEPEDGYQGAPFTTQKLSPEPSDIRQMDVDLAFTTVKNQADRVARIMLNRAQAEKTVVWPMNIEGLKVKALDTVQVDSARYSLSNYAWSVAGWGLSADYGVVLQLREENALIYSEPTVVAPPTVVPIDEADPVLSLQELQLILRDTYAKGLAVTANESGGVASITLSNFSLDYPSPWSDVPVTGTTIGSLAPDTTYFPYVDVDHPTDTTPTFGVTTVYGTALNSSANPRRIFLDRAIKTPASGSGGTSSPSGGGFDSGDGSGTLSYP